MVLPNAKPVTLVACNCNWPSTLAEVSGYRVQTLAGAFGGRQTAALEQLLQALGHIKAALEG